MIGDKLKEARAKHQPKPMTRYTLAKLSGLTRWHISLIEGNKANPQPATKKKLTKAMGLPVGYFDDNIK